MSRENCYLIIQCPQNESQLQFYLGMNYAFNEHLEKQQHNLIYYYSCS